MFVRTTYHMVLGFTWCWARNEFSRLGASGRRGHDVRALFVTGTCWKRQKLSRNLLELNGTSCGNLAILAQSQPKGKYRSPSFIRSPRLLPGTSADGAQDPQPPFLPILMYFCTAVVTWNSTLASFLAMSGSWGCTLLVMSFKICQRRATRRRCACCEQTLRSTRQR